MKAVPFHDELFWEFVDRFGLHLSESAKIKIIDLKKKDNITYILFLDPDLKTIAFTAKDYDDMCATLKEKDIEFDGDLSGWNEIYAMLVNYEKSLEPQKPLPFTAIGYPQF